MSPSRCRTRDSLGASVCLAAVLAAGCGDGGPLGPATATSAGAVGRIVAARQAPKPVPFKATLTATQQVPDPNLPAGCELFVRTTLEGNSTHLGHFTGTGTTCAFNGQFGVMNPPFNPGGGPPPYFVTDFTVQQTYTAANGDVLEVSGMGVRVQSLADGSSGLVGTGVVDGGTGRFAGAMGEFDVAGIDGVVRYDGWILYDAANRSDG